MASKGSKWAKIKDQYPRIALDSDYSEKIEAVLNSPMAECELLTIFGVEDKRPLRALPFELIVKIYNYYRDLKENLENELSTIQLMIEAAEFKVIEHYEANDLLTQKFDDGSSITVAPDPVVSVENAQEFYAWIKADPNRIGAFKLAEYVNPQTAKAGVKALLETNQAPPPGVKVFYDNKLTRRKG